MTIKITKTYFHQSGNNDRRTHMTDRRTVDAIRGSDFRLWTNVELAQFRAWWTEGMPVAEIGRRFHVTKNVIVGKARRMNLIKRATPIGLTGPASPRWVETPGRKRVSHDKNAPKPAMTLPMLKSEEEFKMAEVIEAAVDEATAIGAVEIETPIRRYVTPADKPMRIHIAGARAPGSPLMAARAPRVATGTPTTRTCQFPLWGNERPTHVYCDEPATVKSYCGKHAAMCFGGYRAIEAA